MKKWILVMALLLALAPCFAKAVCHMAEDGIVIVELFYSDNQNMETTPNAKAIATAVSQQAKALGADEFRQIMVRHFYLPDAEFNAILYVYEDGSCFISVTALYAVDDSETIFEDTFDDYSTAKYVFNEGCQSFLDAVQEL